MNFSKQTSMMAALFLSLGVGVPAIAAGAKAGGSSSGSALSPAPSAKGSSAERTRSAENAQTEAEPTAPATDDQVDNTFSVGEQNAPGGHDKAAHKRMGAADKNQHGSLSSLERETVMDLQTALQAEGVYQGSIDGVAGAKTKKALRQYQQARQLEASGRLDEETMRQLGISGAGDQVQPVRGLDDDMAPGSLEGFDSTSPGLGTEPYGSPSDTTDFGTGTGAGTGIEAGPGAGSSTGAGTQRGMGTGRTGTPGSMGTGSDRTGTSPGTTGTTPGSSGSDPAGTGTNPSTGSGTQGGTMDRGTGTQGGTMNRGTGTQGPDMNRGTDMNRGSGTRGTGNADSVVNPVQGQSGSSTSPGGASAPVQP